MGRGLLPCFPALDLGGNDPFSVLLFNHAWGEGDVRFAPLLCGESGPGGAGRSIFLARFVWRGSIFARCRAGVCRKAPSSPIKARAFPPAPPCGAGLFQRWPRLSLLAAAQTLPGSGLSASARPLMAPAPPQPAPSPPAPPPSYAHFRQPGTFAKRRAPLPGASGRGGYRLGIASGRVKRP